MRFKHVTVLALCLLFTAVFQQATFAQDAAPPAKTIPFKSTAFSAKLSPDGKTLVTYENIVLRGLKEVDPSLLPMHVIDISTGEDRGQLSGFSDYAADVAFTRDGSKLISAHMNGDINVWDLASMKVTKSYQTPLMGYTQIKLLPDDKRIVVNSAGVPQRFVVFDTYYGVITQTIGKHFDSFLDFQNNYTQFPAMGDVQYAGFTLSPNGTLLATATANDEVGLWSLADNSYQEIRKKSDQFGLFSIRQLAFTADGWLVYYDASDKKTHIWDTAGKSEKAALDLGSDTFALSPDGKMIAWGTMVKDAANTVSVASLDAPDKATVILTLPDGVRVAPRVTSLAFTPDSKQLVVSGLFVSDESTNQIYVLNVLSA